MRIPRSLGVAAMATALALTTTSCASDGDAVEFGYIPDFNGASLLAIAEDQGLWEKHGLDVTTKSFTDGPLQIQALDTGDLDFGYIGPGAFWLPASGKAKIVAMNTLGQADRVVGQPGIETMEDLRGKKVAVPEGTSGDMILTLALQKADMTKDDIEVVPMKPSSIVSALSSGKVDGAGLWYPALATVKEQVPDLVEIANNSDFEDTVAFPTAFVAGNDVVSEDQGKAEKVLAALREAIEYRAENLDKTIELTAGFTDLDPADVEDDAENVEVLSLKQIDKLTEDGTVDKWLSGMVDYFVDSGQLSETVEPNEFYTADMFLTAGKDAE